MNGSAFDLVTSRGTQKQMLDAARRLDPLGLAGTAVVLTADEIAGLEENARRVAAKYWTTKGMRSAQSVQNQLDRGRWHYLDQARYAKDVILEVAADSGCGLKCYP